jgi:hypothetical protein
MKCIRCSTDNNLKDRTLHGGRCSNCRHPFCFEPTTMGAVKITDTMFAKTLTDISVNGTLSFTRPQFASFLDKRLRSKTANWVGGLMLISIPILIWAVVVTIGGGFLDAFPFILFFFGLNALSLWLRLQGTSVSRTNRRTLSLILIVWGIFLLVIGTIIGLISQSGFAVIASIAIGGLSLLGGLQQLKNNYPPQPSLVSLDSANGWLDNWQHMNGPIANLLPPPNNATSNPPQLSGDITHYSFDRLIVCDRDSIAHFLIANNFHFENNCAILSIDRYPTDIFESVMTMVRRNPDLTVFVIHDCSAKGLLTTDRIRNEAAWFANTSVTIVDIGLLPRQILEAKRGFTVAQSTSQGQRATQLPTKIRQSLLRAELDWLDAGNTVSLESIAPRQLMTALQRAIAKSQVALGDEFVSDSGLMMTDSSSDYFWVDSFG